jgi:hypothetical protein
MAKFIVGVMVGRFLGASATAYGATTSRSGTLSGWAVTKDSVDVCSDPNATETCNQNNGSHSWRATLSR